MIHLISVTWQHIRRSPYQAAAAVMIMTLTMFVGLSFFLLSITSRQFLAYLEQRPKIIAFYKDVVTEESQLKEVIDRLKETEKLKNVKFVSKEEAFRIYKERYKKDPLLLEFVTDNALPTSLEVSAINVSDLPALYEILRRSPNLEDIQYQKDVINNLIVILDWGRKVGVGLIVFLVITSVFMILTIIGLKIALRKDEIEVQRLVGASKWYIRMPFLMEGFFYGAIGAIISWAIIYLGVVILTPNLYSFLADLKLLPVSFILMLEVLAITIMVGGFVGSWGSFLAVWRYLRD